MFDTLSQTTAIIFAATSRAVLASPRPPAPCPAAGGCFCASMIFVQGVPVAISGPEGSCTDNGFPHL